MYTIIIEAVLIFTVLVLMFFLFKLQSKINKVKQDLEYLRKSLGGLNQ